MARPSKDIQTDLDNVNKAITRVLTGGQKYSFDTGQTKQMNERANLNDLRKLKQSLESELSLALKCENGTNRGRGVNFVRRY